MKVFNRASEIIYSDDRDIVGKAHPESPALQRALGGRVERHRAGGQHRRRVLP